MLSWEASSPTVWNIESPCKLVLDHVKGKGKNQTFDPDPMGLIEPGVAEMLSNRNTGPPGAVNKSTKYKPPRFTNKKNDMKEVN